ncbi:MAG: OsmC family protein [Bacteroidota bacterium]
MVTSKVIYLSDLRTQAIHLKSNDEIFTDAPVDNHGKGEAFSPTDLFSTSLASCMLTILGIHAANSNYSINGTYAEVTKIMEENPRRVGEIIVDLYFPKSKFDQKQKRIIENVVKTCPVSKSLHPEIKQIIRFNF